MSSSSYIEDLTLVFEVTQFTNLATEKKYFNKSKFLKNQVAFNPEETSFTLTLQMGSR